jgi:hypothetical protein
MTLDIKVVALDIYGTVLASDDYDNWMAPRAGLVEFFNYCDKKAIKIVGSSDASINMVKAELKTVFDRHDECQMSLDRFFGFFQLNQQPFKDYSLILRYFKILASGLYVIGDSDKDINGAKALGGPYYRCPEYRVDGERTFSFKDIIVELEK